MNCLTEGHVPPFQVTLLPLPPDLCAKESCPYIGERRRRNAADIRAEIRNRMPVMPEEGRQALGYGCQFLHLDEADEEALRRYVFQTEPEQRRRLRNA